MSLQDILILVKTYPEISRKYTETVCTAGILADSNKMVRLYPIRFRYLEGKHKFSKYQWIKAKISKATADPRPESYSIDQDSIILGETIPPNNMWSERRQWVLNENTVFKSMEELHSFQEKSGTSLGIFKPREVTKLTIKAKDKNDIKEATAKKDSIVNQLDMFEEKKDIYILPERLVLHFFCDDARCGGHKLSILDWEFGQLLRRLKRKPNWQAAVKDKILNEIFAKNRDTYIMVGNMVSRQHIFSILGFFWPPYDKQMKLF